MSLTTLQISDEARIIWTRAKWTKETGPGKRFKHWMKEIEKNPPTPDVALLKLYDFYQETLKVNPSFSEIIRDGLFKLLSIEPKKPDSCSSSCMSFFCCYDERYDPKSLNNAIKKMDEAIDKVKHPEQNTRMVIR